MEKLKWILICAILIIASHSAGAQTDSIRKNSDSLNTLIFQDYNKKLADAEQQRKVDSLTKVNLEIQLNSLKANDILKREALQKQLQVIRGNETTRVALKKAQIDSLRKNAKAYPVIGFFNDSLFLIYSKLGSFSPKERADAISNRIKKLGQTFNFSPDLLKITPSETTVDLVFGESIIVSISENDAIWNNTSKVKLAETYKKIIVKTINSYKSETNVLTLLKNIGFALLVVAIFGVLIFYILKFFVWTSKKIVEQKGKLIRDFKIKNYTLFDKERSVTIVLSANTIVKWAIILLIIYIAVPIIFGIFPWTQNLAQTLFGYILNPVKKIAISLWDFLPNLITIIVIVIVFRYVLKGVRFLKIEIERENLHIPGFYSDWANPTYQIVRVLIFAFMIVVIFPYLPGSDSPVFRGVSVFLGFLFTFGSAGSLSNIMAGLILTYMRLFKIGDRVKIGEVVGDVIEKSLLVTRIRTIKNEIISIPNSTVMSSHTINYSSDAPDKGLIVHTTVTIGYDVPWKDMHQALIDAALNTDLLLQEPKPFVLQTSLDDFYVSYQINAYTKEPNKQAVIYSNLHQNIQDVCNERGIEILSPHYRAQRDGNSTTIPSGYLAKDYKSPSFKINVQKDIDDN